MLTTANDQIAISIASDASLRGNVPTRSQIIKNANAESQTSPSALVCSGGLNPFEFIH